MKLSNEFRKRTGTKTIASLLHQFNRRKTTVAPTKLIAAPTLSDDVPITNKQHDQTKLLGLFQKKRVQPYISPRKRATTPSEEERGTLVHQSMQANNKNDDIEEYEEEPPKKKQMLVKQPLGIVKSKFTPPRAAVQPKPSQVTSSFLKLTTKTSALSKRASEPPVIPSPPTSTAPQPIDVDIDLDDFNEPHAPTPARKSLFANNNKGNCYH